MKNVFYFEDDGFIKVKDYKPKYQKIELVISDKEASFVRLDIKVKNFKEVVEKYGNYQVLSVANYDEPKSTSMVIGDCENVYICD